MIRFERSKVVLLLRSKRSIHTIAPKIKIAPRVTAAASVGSQNQNNCYTWTAESSKSFLSAFGVTTGLALAATAAFVNQQENHVQCSVFSNERQLDNVAIGQKYDPLRTVLGEGAYGKVYKTRRKHDGIPVAIKVIDKQYTHEGDFQREIRALRILSDNEGHPHVCRMYDIHHNANENYYYVAMELITGGELFDHLITGGAYSEQDASKFLKQHAEALVFIHSKRYIHADLKPENLMMSSVDREKAQLKVVDFGSSLSFDELQNPNNLPAHIGTSAYLPPEMFHWRRKVSPAIDMFATGIIMYILLTGTHPFDPTGTTTDEEIEVAIKSIGRRGFLDKLVFDHRTDHLSHDAKELLRALLNPDFKRRMTSAEFLVHPWVQGSTASQKIIAESDSKLRNFWQRRFQNAIITEFATATGRGGESSLSDKDIGMLFHALDLDGNGTLEINEIKTALGGILGDDKSLDKIFRSVDEDDSGMIDFSEFKRALRKKFDNGPGVGTHGTKRFQSVILQRFDPKHGLSDVTLRKIFDAIDLDGNGELTIDELETVLGSLARKDEEHVSDWVDSIDADLNGTINFEEFRDAMRKIFK